MNTSIKNIEHPTLNTEHRMADSFHSPFGRSLFNVGCSMLALFLLFPFTGCANIREALVHPVIPTTNVVETVTIHPSRTNTVVQGTDSVTTITPESAQTNYTTNIVWQVNPETSQTIETGRRFNSALNPTPSAPFVDWGLTLIAVACGVYARFKTGREQKAKDLLHTVIAGVEAANNPDVKAKIRETAVLFKTQKHLDAEVQDRTP